MPIFYRGAGVGTHWHINDARLTGFTPQAPGIVLSIDRLMQHIVSGTVSSPYGNSGARVAGCGNSCCG
jgi:hypothetical protein